jgi:hypothetical protein
MWTAICSVSAHAGAAWAGSARSATGWPGRAAGPGTGDRERPRGDRERPAGRPRATGCWRRAAPGLWNAPSQDATRWGRESQESRKAISFRGPRTGPAPEAEIARPTDADRPHLDGGGIRTRALVRVARPATGRFTSTSAGANLVGGLVFLNDRRRNTPALAHLLAPFSGPLANF